MELLSNVGGDAKRNLITKTIFRIARYSKMRALESKDLIKEREIETFISEVLESTIPGGSLSAGPSTKHLIVCINPHVASFKNVYETLSLMENCNYVIEGEKKVSRKSSPKRTKTLELDNSLLSLSAAIETPVKSEKMGVYAGSKSFVSERFSMLKPVLTPKACLLYTSPSPRDGLLSRMPSSA
eukprot:TRINITY_DN2908_c0_g1_i4.p2 TRINITY_DN2908_c0_g1~~TRINITY_DN2908_c0_g1_i4.p2  ORF type:complete len:184 (+),score=38.62 TRINITY_DN2908_c0_g1_i4:1668-2219(+)